MSPQEDSEYCSQNKLRKVCPYTPTGRHPPLRVAVSNSWRCLAIFVAEGAASLLRGALVSTTKKMKYSYGTYMHGSFCVCGVCACVFSSRYEPSRSLHPIPYLSVLISTRHGQFPWSQENLPSGKYYSAGRTDLKAFTAVKYLIHVLWRMAHTAVSSDRQTAEKTKQKHQVSSSPTTPFAADVRPTPVRCTWYTFSSSGFRPAWAAGPQAHHQDSGRLEEGSSAYLESQRPGSGKSSGAG